MKRLLLSAALLLASASWADIPPPDTATCGDKQAVATCETDEGKSGTCQQSKCSRLDYSNGTPPTSVEYDCLKCAADTAKPSGNGCSAVPGAPLAATALLAGWLSRRRSRGA
jgi:uncharacterized protein (TIGR03382 family)